MKRWSSRLVTRTKQFNRELSFIESRDADGNSDDEDSSKPNQEEEEEKEEESEDTGGKQERKQRVLALSDLQVRISYDCLNIHDTLYYVPLL